MYRGILARAPEHEIDPSFDRTLAVMELLGDPQKAYRVVHVTGTNGKTSTSRMVERLVREHGLRTGRFTSPHLSRVNERIVIDGEPISDERFVEVWQDVAPYVHLVDQRSAAEGKPQLSFFEVFTVMAFAAFADAPVDVAVVEVGMGGLWDSTNVADGEVAIITPISMDHERYLGDTLLDIASVKAGIIKDGATLVLAAQQEDVEGVVLAAAAEKGARVVREGVDIEVGERQVAVGGQLITLQTLGGTYTEIFLPLHGEFQAHNALLALTATEALLTGGRALDPGVVEVAFADVDSPGRLEVVRSSPTIIVDGAHNPAGVEALVVRDRGGVRVPPARRHRRRDGGQGPRGDALAARAGARRDGDHPCVEHARARGRRPGGGGDRHLRRGPGARGRAAERRPRPRGGPCGERGRARGPASWSPARSCSWRRRVGCSAARRTWSPVRVTRRGQRRPCTNVHRRRTSSP